MDVKSTFVNALVFCCSLCDWLKNHAPFSRFFLDQSDVKPQEIVTCSHHTGFLALGSSCMYMYLNAIGSFKCLGIFDWPEGNSAFGWFCVTYARMNRSEFDANLCTCYQVHPRKISFGLTSYRLRKYGHAV